MNKSKYGLSANVLKLIAIITMTIDHIGLILLNDYTPFRIIGRIAFPIFAYFISEGCRYTKNRFRYFLNVFLLGVVCQGIFFGVGNSLHNNILLTFSISILFVYVYNWFILHKKGIVWIILSLSLLYIAIELLSDYNITFDYGFYGIILPWIISLSNDKNYKLLLTIAGLTLISLSLQGIQWYSFLAIPFLFLYNGKRGKLNIKYFFYAFYPLHMVIIYIIDLLINTEIYR